MSIDTITIKHEMPVATYTAISKSARLLKLTEGQQLTAVRCCCLPLTSVVLSA